MSVSEYRTRPPRYSSCGCLARGRSRPAKTSRTFDDADPGLCICDCVSLCRPSRGFYYRNSSTADSAESGACPTRPVRPRPCGVRPTFLTREATFLLILRNSYEFSSRSLSLSLSLLHRIAFEVCSLRADRGLSLISSPFSRVLPLRLVRCHLDHHAPPVTSTSGSDMGSECQCRSLRFWIWTRAGGTRRDLFKLVSLHHQHKPLSVQSCVSVPISHALVTRCARACCPPHHWQGRRRWRRLARAISRSRRPPRS